MVFLLASEFVNKICFYLRQLCTFWTKSQSNKNGANPASLPLFFLLGSEAISGFVARQFVGEVCGTLQGHDHRNSPESLSGEEKNNDRNIDSVVMKKTHSRNLALV